METTVSKDGTTIAFAASGSGPAVILVAGAFGYHAFGPNVGLVPLLAEHVRAVLYDRRGRGDSGDTQPFERVREVDDLDAVIKAVGGSAFVYGISSGAALAAEAASALGPERITKLAMYEPSYILDDTHAPVRSTYLPRLRELLAEGRRGDMVALFLTEAVGKRLFDGGPRTYAWRLVTSTPFATGVVHLGYELAGAPVYGDTGLDAAGGDWPPKPSRDVLEMMKRPADPGA